MNLAIIGAGESTRLKAEGLKSSKHLIKINDEYLIERIIRIAKNNDTEKIYCIINSHEPDLKNYLLKTNFGIPLELVIKDTISSMHSLFELAPYLIDKPFCLATTDSVFYEREFSEFMKYSISQTETDGVLAITKFIDDEKPLCVLINENNTILEFSDFKEGYRWATGGIYYFKPNIFNEIESASAAGILRLRNFFRHLLNKGYLLRGFSFSKIIDVDHVSDIKKAEEFLISEEH